MPKLGITNSIVRNHPRRRTLSGGGSLIPASGLSLWLRADAGVTNNGDGVMNGDQVTDWADQSGSGNNASGYGIAFGQGGDPPTFVNSEINSKPAISFNDDGSWMRIPQSNIGDNGNISIFVVLNYFSGAVLLNKGDAATFEATAWEITTINGFGFVDPAEEDSAWNVVPTSIVTGTPLLLEAFSDETVSQLAFNGVNSGEPSDGNEFGTNNISQYIGIGGGGTDGANQGNPLDARIAEIIIYNRPVTTPERQQVETYLMEKYAIAPNGIGSDNPANAARADATASLLIDGPLYNTQGNPASGFIGGQSWRTMELSIDEPNGRPSYYYGNETVLWTGSQWKYQGSRVFSTSSSNVDYPWLATAWTDDYSVAKVIPSYAKPSMYPGVP